MSKIEAFAIAVVVSYVAFLGSYFKASELATRTPQEGTAIAAELPTYE
jgi:hypothetical protein